MGQYTPAQAHPRSRGENPTTLTTRTRSRGSSPLTRGKHSDETLSFHPARLIPAHAGKTIRPTLTLPVLTAHPRSRGENSSTTSLMSPRYGSSPLTRGKLVEFVQSVFQSRLIPAHAGKTVTAVVAAEVWQAHPRSRGENSSTPSCPCCLKGSSPLTRGKPA